MVTVKNLFCNAKIDFPILVHRNSALILSSKQVQKLEKLGISFEELFLPLTDLIDKKVKERSTLVIDFSKERTHLELLFKQLEAIAAKTDKSFMGAVKAQHQKQLNGLNKLEKRLLKAEKRQQQNYVLQLTALQSALFRTEFYKSEL